MLEQEAHRTVIAKLAQKCGQGKFCRGELRLSLGQVEQQGFSVSLALNDQMLLVADRCPVTLVEGLAIRLLEFATEWPIAFLGSVEPEELCGEICGSLFLAWLWWDVEGGPICQLQVSLIRPGIQMPSSGRSFLLAVGCRTAS